MAQVSKKIRRNRRKNPKRHAQRSVKKTPGQQALRDRQLREARAHGIKASVRGEESEEVNQNASHRRRRPVFGPDGLTDLERFLGFTRPPGTPPFEGARKVPHTCDNWY